MESAEAEFGTKQHAEEESELGRVFEGTNEASIIPDLEDEVGENSEDNSDMRKALGKRDEMKGILEKDVFKEGKRTVKTLVKETVFESKPKEDEDSKPQSKNAGIVTHDHTVSTHVVLGEVNATVSSNISCTESEIVYFRPKKSRQEREYHLPVQEPIKTQRWKRSTKCYVYALDFLSKDMTSGLSILSSCQESYLCEQNIWCSAFISVIL